jgi:hypothetical protein
LPAAPTGLAQATPEQDALLRRLLSERTGAPAPLRLLHLQPLAPTTSPVAPAC